MFEPPHPRRFKRRNNKSIVNVRIGMVTAIVLGLLLFVYSNEAPRRGGIESKWVVSESRMEES